MQKVCDAHLMACQVFCTAAATTLQTRTMDVCLSSVRFAKPQGRAEGHWKVPAKGAAALET